MSKRFNRKYKISRRIGAALWGSKKDSYNKKNYPPGMHGISGYKRPTEYGIQLIAKQKLKKYYGDIREKQFKATYKEANRRKGDTGENLVSLLESRLDSFIYRAKFATTIFASRQFVVHKHVKVNGCTVNIPSYRLQLNDIVEVQDKSKNLDIFLKSIATKERNVPDYIKIDNTHSKATYFQIPVLKKIPFPVQMEPSLVVEFYSR